MTSASERKSGFGRKLLSRILHTYFLLTRGLTIGVRAIVRTGDGKFLLVRHTYTPGWHFPGGGVEKSETTEQALINELAQETGLKLIGKPTLQGVFHNSEVSKRDHVLVYLCDVDGELPSKPPSMEIAEVGYFGLSDLPSATDPGTVRRMQEIEERLVPDQIW